MSVRSDFFRHIKVTKNTIMLWVGIKCSICDLIHVNCQCLGREISICVELGQWC